MTMFTSKNLVAVAVAAIVCLVVVFYGCSRKNEPAPEGENKPAAEGEVVNRLEDPQYRAALDERLNAQKELTTLRYRLVTEMQAKIAAAKERLATEDEAVLKAELEKDPEWNSLYKRVEDLNTALEDERKRAEAVVRNRIMSDAQKESSKK